MYTVSCNVDCNHALVRNMSMYTHGGSKVLSSFLSWLGEYVFQSVCESLSRRVGHIVGSCTSVVRYSANVRYYVISC